MKGGGFGGMNMQSMMQQARKMQEAMVKAQEELEAAEIEGTAGGGLVTVIVNGNGVLRTVKLKESVVDPDDVEMLEDLIVAAYGDATAKADEMKQRLMPAGTNGLLF